MNRCGWVPHSAEFCEAAVSKRHNGLAEHPLVDERTKCLRQRGRKRRLRSDGRLDDTRMN